MRPHRTDGVSLSFGLIFLAVVAFWAVTRFVPIDLPAVGWLVAGGLLLFGLVGLLGALRSSRRDAAQPPVQAEAAVEPDLGLPPEMHADIVRELMTDPRSQVGDEPVMADRPADRRADGDARP